MVQAVVGRPNYKPSLVCDFKARFVVPIGLLINLITSDIWMLIRIIKYRLIIKYIT